MRIDFCCGGNIPLSEAVAQGGLNMDNLLTELNVVLEKSTSSKTDLDVWTKSDSNTIIDHVITNYHRVSEEELTNLSPYVTKFHAFTATITRNW